MSPKIGHKGTNMSNVYRAHSNYFGRAFGDIEDIAHEMGNVLKGIEYDTMVGTGLSGTLVVPTLARTFGKHWAIVRKEKSPHASGMIEGDIGQSWLFVDDFISSGATFQRVQDVIKGLKVWEQYDYHSFETKCVGAYCYEHSGQNAFEPFRERMRNYGHTNQY